MVLPRVKRVVSLLGNVWRWMAKVLCKQKMRRGCCCVMQSPWRVLRSVVACGSVVVRITPSILCNLGVFSGVQMRTFLMEMTCMMLYRVMMLARSGGNGRVGGMFSFQHVRRAKKMRKPRWRKVSLFSYSSGPRSVRGPTLSVRNSRRSLMVLMWGVVMVRNLVMGGEVGDVAEGLIGAFKKVGQSDVEI